MLWTGRILSTLSLLFLLVDSSLKIIQAAPAVEGSSQLGYPVRVIAPLGIVLLACTLLYGFMRCHAQQFLARILLTGYWGGAAATHVRAGNPLFSPVLFPVNLGVMIWGGLFLRDAQVRKLIPWRSSFSRGTGRRKWQPEDIG